MSDEFTILEEGKEVIRITSDGKAIPGEGLSLSQGIAKMIEILSAQFQSDMLKRLEKAEQERDAVKHAKDVLVELTPIAKTALDELVLLLPKLTEPSHNHVRKIMGNLSPVINKAEKAIKEEK